MPWKDVECPICGEGEQVYQTGPMKIEVVCLTCGETIMYDNGELRLLTVDEQIDLYSNPEAALVQAAWDFEFEIMAIVEEW